MSVPAGACLTYAFRILGVFYENSRSPAGVRLVFRGARSLRAARLQKQALPADGEISSFHKNASPALPSPCGKAACAATGAHPGAWLPSSAKNGKKKYKQKIFLSASQGAFPPQHTPPPWPARRQARRRARAKEAHVAIWVAKRKRPCRPPCRCGKTRPRGRPWRQSPGDRKDPADP